MKNISFDLIELANSLHYNLTNLYFKVENKNRVEALINMRNISINVKYDDCGRFSMVDYKHLEEINFLKFTKEEQEKISEYINNYDVEIFTTSGILIP